MSLTDTQEQLVDFIHRYIFLNDNFPSVKEIAARFEVWPNAIHQNIKLLEKKGFIEQVYGRQCYRRTDKFKEHVSYKRESCA